MLNGRHLVLLGGLAAAGLLSVREGQRQIEAGYRIAIVEKEIRAKRVEIRQCKTEHLALQSPRAVSVHASELKLAVLPVPAGALSPPVAQANPPPAAHAPRRVLPAPPPPIVPQLPNAAPLLNSTDAPTAYH